MVTRRNFIKTVSMATAGLALGTGDSLFAAAAAGKGPGRKGKVKIAYIGIGNRGEQIINEFARTGMVEVVALCDVDLDGKGAIPDHNPLMVKGIGIRGTFQRVESVILALWVLSDVALLALLACACSAVSASVSRAFSI